MSQVLAIEALTLARGRLTLLEDFDLSIGEGQCVELRGANGTGKSTLLRTVAGLSASAAGRIDVQPHLYVGHTDGLSALLTVEENLQWYASLAGSPVSTDQVREALGALHVAKLRRRPCSALSAGQRRRAALARLLLIQRPLWLLDEPYTALDDDGAACVDTLIRTHCSSGGAVLAATHADMSVSDSRIWLDR